MQFRKKRSAMSRTVWILIIILVVAAFAAIEYALGLGSTSGSAKEVDLHIIEDNPVLQLDHFYADTLYIPYGQNISLAVQNTDDETRVFVLSAFNVNLSLSSGTTQRVTISPNKMGNFTFMSPIAPPSVLSQGRKAPCLVGFFIVTQNQTQLSTTTTGTGHAPSINESQAAANGPVGGCSAHPLTVP